jgi:hypothetical protein
MKMSTAPAARWKTASKECQLRSLCRARFGNHDAGQSRGVKIGGSLSSNTDGRQLSDWQRNVGAIGIMCDGNSSTNQPRVVRIEI